MPAVNRAIAGLGLGDQDSAAVKLAQRYAAVIDASGRHCTGCDDDGCKHYNDSWAMRWIGPLLLDALESLGATPGSRKEKPNPGQAAPNRLQALRDARRA